METLYRVPFLVLECPNLKLKKPPWVHMPSAMTVYALVVVSYFLITGGNSAGMGRVGAQAARSEGAWPPSRGPRLTPFPGESWSPPCSLSPSRAELDIIVKPS